MKPQPLMTPVQDAWKLPTWRGPTACDKRTETPYVLRLEGDRRKRRVYVELDEGGTKTHSISINGKPYVLTSEEFAKVERLAARGLW